MTLAACTAGQPSADSQDAEGTSTLCHRGDSAINRAVRFYAGISRDGIDMPQKDAKAWETYASIVRGYLQRSQATRSMIDDIARTDFSDFRDSVDYVFYPFSGADFIYPVTLYPDADTYFLCGLEKTGEAIATNVVTTFRDYDSYRHALASYFHVSYFVTREMSADVGVQELETVCPVITMLMALSNCEIVSISYKDFDAEGHIVDVPVDAISDLLEIHFFRLGSDREQTLFYFSGNLADTAIDARLLHYLGNTLPQHTVGTYLKAASFLLHFDHFATIRENILKHSHTIVQDDSGIPYRFLAPSYSVKLYGVYKDPTQNFSQECYQPDLEKLYRDSASHIKPLPFRIGYNNPSNWIVARRK